MADFTQQIYRYRLIYVLGWAGLIVSVIYSAAMDAWVLLLISYIWSRVVTLFGMIIGLHRFFSHRSFETGPWRKRFLLAMGVLDGEGSPLSWAMVHRHHHKHSDSVQDIHSPKESLILSAFTWQIQPLSWYQDKKNMRTLPRDLWRDTEVRFVDRYYYHIWALLICVSAVIDWQFCLFFILAPVGWGYLHAILINTFCHMHIPGNYRNFNLADDSQNNKLIAWLTFGEGYHNNHHANSLRTPNTVNPNEIDPAGWLIEKFFRTNK